MFEKLMNFFGALGTFVLTLIAALVILCIIPVLVLWSINTITEQSGINFYIPHNIFTYASVILLWIILSPVKVSHMKK